MGNLALSKVNLLNKVMAGIVRAIHRESDDRKLINPRPYFRLLLNLVVELTAPDPGFDASSYQVGFWRYLMASYQVGYLMRPSTR